MSLTFHPEINKDNYTDRINSNFLERNYSSPRNGKNMNEYTEKTPFCERKIQTIESIRNQKSSPGKRLYEQGRDPSVHG